MAEDRADKLWKSYSKNRTLETRNAIIENYVPLVKIVAGRLSMYLGYTVDYEDLVSYGVFGLIDAVDKFDTTKDIKFETYASLRIRGAILDQIRKMDWIPRSLRQKQKRMDSVRLELESGLNRPATDQEMADKLEISLDEYHKWEGQLKITGISSLEDCLEQGTEVSSQGNTRAMSDQPDVAMEQKDLARILKESLELLTDKERKVILLYYYEDMTLKEISAALEVSESRVSQLHTKALRKMREKLGNQMELLKG